MKNMIVEFGDKEYSSLEIIREKELGSGRGAEVFLMEGRINNCLESLLIAEKRYSLDVGLNGIITKTFIGCFSNLLFLTRKMSMP